MSKRKTSKATTPDTIDRDPCANVYMRPTIMLNPDEWAMIQCLAKRLNRTPIKALTELVHLHLMSCVDHWEKNCPEEYAAVQERFWQRVDDWLARHGTGKRPSKQ